MHAKDTLDGVTRIFLQLVFSYNILAFLFNGTIYTPLSAQKFIENDLPVQLGRVSISLFFTGLCLVCVFF